jgi:predicted dehydrogenase
MWKGAVVGLGSIALRAHLPAFTSEEALRGRARIVAGVDPLPAHRLEAERLVPGLRTYADLEALLREESVDFVDICAPPHTHAALIEAAARNDCHILCEKPVTCSLGEAHRLRPLLLGSPLVFMPCHQYRYATVWSHLGHLLATHRLGRFGFARIEILRPGPDPGSDWRPFWRVDPRVSGGGILTDIGSHYVYLLRSLLGRPERVSARVQTVNERWTGVEDTALVTFQYARGWVELHLTWSAQRRETRFHFAGSQAAAGYDGQWLHLEEEGRVTPLVQEELSDKSTYTRWYARLFLDFLDRIEKDEPASRHNGYLEALSTAEVLDACYRAAELHCEVEISA